MPVVHMRYAIIDRDNGGEVLAEANYDLAKHEETIGARLAAHAEIVDAITRCGHGRRIGDACNGCPKGRSVGGPKRGEIVGHDMNGEPCVVPEKPSDWRPERWWPTRDEVTGG